MVCIIALVVFSVLGIFSAAYRQLAKEAFACVMRRVMFRPCDVKLQDKLRAQLVGKLMRHWGWGARMLNKYFEIFAWLFVALAIASTFYVARGAYNYYLYGNCNGLNSTGFCLFDPTGSNEKFSQTSTSCSTSAGDASKLTLAHLDLSLFPHKAGDATKKIVFIGCYLCDYTRAVYPTIKELLSKYNVDFTFIHFPVKPGSDYLSNYAYCANKLDPQKFWTFNDLLFASSKDSLSDNEYVAGLAQKAGYDENQMISCVSSEATHVAVENLFAQTVTTNIYGTPTIFVNGQPVVGPNPLRVYERLLNQ